MKKTKLFVFFMLLGIGISFLIPSKVFANTIAYGNADYLYNYLTQFKFGYAYATDIIQPVEWQGDTERFVIFLEEEPSHVIEQNYFEFNVNDDLHYFEPVLQDAITHWAFLEFSYPLAFILENDYQIEDFDGTIYWNFQEKYWQIEYYMSTELDYYIQRINYLENLVANLSNDLYEKSIEIHLLQAEIRNLEDLLDTEFDRGYVAGYDVGYNDGYSEGVIASESEAYEQGFKDGQNSKLAQNNEAFYKGIEKWLVPAIITVIALGGFVTIAVRKRREE